MDVIRNTGISSSTLYEQILPSLKPFWLTKVGDRPSKKGSTETSEAYEPMPLGILLLGVLCRKKGLTFEAINLDSENPFN